MFRGLSFSLFSLGHFNVEMVGPLFAPIKSTFRLKLVPSLPVGKASVKVHREAALGHFPVGKASVKAHREPALGVKGERRDGLVYARSEGAAVLGRPKVYRLGTPHGALRSPPRPFGSLLHARVDGTGALTMMTFLLRDDP